MSALAVCRRITRLSTVEEDGARHNLASCLGRRAPEPDKAGAAYQRNARHGAVYVHAQFQHGGGGWGHWGAYLGCRSRRMARDNVIGRFRLAR